MQDFGRAAVRCGSASGILATSAWGLLTLQDSPWITDILAWQPRATCRLMHCSEDLLLDHPICTQHEPSRNLMTDFLRGPQIDDQLEACRLFDRNVGRLCTTQQLDELRAMISR